jgi:hypothetical protein
MGFFKVRTRSLLLTGLILLLGLASCAVIGVVISRSLSGGGPPISPQGEVDTPVNAANDVGLATPTVTAMLVPVKPAPLPPRPESTLPSHLPTRSPKPSPVISTSVPANTLAILRDTMIPISDLYDLAYRLEEKSDIPSTYPAPDEPLQIGDTRTFWVLNVDTNQPYQVIAGLRYITDHLYFWIEEGIVFNRNEVHDLAEAFENHIYPTDRAFFGSEWTPGVDDDPHIYVLYVKDAGSTLAGLFSSKDEYSPLVYEYSNAHELFLLNANRLKLGRESIYHVLAHEFQHMIHWYRDRNEAAWLNEGFSELAALINGYPTGNFALDYANDPDIQLNDWPGDTALVYGHYGASFLFTTYFLDRFGEEVTQALVGEQENGMESLDSVLTEMGITDPLTGKAIGADDVFIDWAVANYLQDSSVADGRYTYHLYSQVPLPKEAERIWSCPEGRNSRDVSQYGVDYIRITCQGEYTLHFEGGQQVKLLPQDPYSGSSAFWSNQGDESDMTLTRKFDFTGHFGSLTLSYWTWYDLEEDYDYVYLEASLDGENWQILDTPSGTREDKSGNSYGWGYNGFSGGGPRWIQEQVDLSRFAGQRVTLRFEYVTDGEVNGEGFVLDDVAVPEIGYLTDFESSDGGWEGNGFVRVQNELPQTFRLALIKRGRTTTVEDLQLDEDGKADIPLSIGGDTREVILVVSGTTRFTRQKADYWLEITKK